MEWFRNLGRLQVSQCFLKRHGLCKHVISDSLLIPDCFTKSLLICYWAVYMHRWRCASRKSNMGFVQTDVWKGHLLTAKKILDKETQAQTPVLIVYLCLSRAMDKVHWPALWQALRAPCISDHLICIFHKIYQTQQGLIPGVRLQQAISYQSWGAARMCVDSSFVLRGFPRNNGRMACDGFRRPWV